MTYRRARPTLALSGLSGVERDARTTVESTSPATWVTRSAAALTSETPLRTVSTIWAGPRTESAMAPTKSSVEVGSFIGRHSDWWASSASCALSRITWPMSTVL